MHRRTLLCLIGAGVITVHAAARVHAQTPAHSVLRVIVPVPAGGTSDMVARALAAQLAKSLGQPVVIENKPGATGQIAVDALRQAKADGSSLLLAPIALPVVNPLLNPRAPNDASRALAPVAQVAQFSYAIAVRADHPARNVRELIAWLNANPARADFGTGGSGSVPHLIGLMIAKATGVKWQHVPYRGYADVQTEIINRDIPVGIGATSDLLAFHQAGKLRIIATTGSSRAPLLAAVPTLQEQGIPVEAVGWTALFAPEGTPRSVIDALSVATIDALSAAEVRSSFRTLGVEPTGTTPEALSAIIKADRRIWAPVVRASGLMPE